MEASTIIRNESLNRQALQEIEGNILLEKMSDIKSFESPLDLARFLFELFGQDPKNIDYFLNICFTSSGESRYPNETEVLYRINDCFGLSKGGRANVKKSEGGKTSEIYINNKRLEKSQIEQIVKLFKNSQIVNWLKENYFKPETAMLTWLTVSLLNVAYQALKECKNDKGESIVINNILGYAEIFEWQSLLYFHAAEEMAYIEDKVISRITSGKASPEMIADYNSNIKPESDTKTKYTKISSWWQKYVYENTGELEASIKDNQSSRWIKHAKTLPEKRLFAEVPVAPTSYLEFANDKVSSGEISTYAKTEKAITTIDPKILNLLQEITTVKFPLPAQTSPRLEAGREHLPKGWFEHEQNLANIQKILAEQRLRELSNQLLDSLKKQNLSSSLYSEINLSPQQDIYIRGLLGQQTISKGTKVLEVLQRFMTKFTSTVDVIEPNLGRAKSENIRLAHYFDKEVGPEQGFIPEDLESPSYTTILYRLIESLSTKSSLLKVPVEVNFKSKIPEDQLSSLSKTAPFLAGESDRYRNLEGSNIVKHERPVVNELKVLYPAVVMYLIHIMLDPAMALTSGIGAVLSVGLSERYNTITREKFRTDHLPVDTIYTPSLEINDVIADTYKFNEKYSKINFQTLVINICSYLVLSTSLHLLFPPMKPGVTHLSQINESQNNRPKEKKLVAKILSGSHNTPIPNQVLLNNLAKNNQKAITENSSTFQLESTNINTFNLAQWSDTSKYIVMEYPSINPLQKLYVPQGYQPKVIFYHKPVAGEIVGIRDQKTGFNSILSTSRNPIRKAIVVVEKLPDNHASQVKIFSPDLNFVQDIPKEAKMNFKPDDWNKYIPNNPKLANSLKDLHIKYSSGELNETEILQKLFLIEKYPYEFNGLATNRDKLQETVFEIANKMEEKGIICNQANTLASVAYTLITGLSSGVVQGYVPNNPEIYDSEAHEIAFFVDSKGQVWLVDYTPRSGPDADFAKNTPAQNPVLVETENFFTDYRPYFNHVISLGGIALGGFVLLKRQQILKNIQQIKKQKQDQVILDKIQQIQSEMPDQYIQLPVLPEQIDLYKEFSADNSPLPFLCKVFERLSSIPDDQKHNQTEMNVEFLEKILKQNLKSKATLPFKQSLNILKRLDQGMKVDGARNKQIADLLSAFISKYDGDSFVEAFRDENDNNSDVEMLRNMYTVLNSKFTKNNILKVFSSLTKPLK